MLKIELSGIDAGNVDGLFLGNSSTSGRDSSGSVVKGLVINQFQRNGIFVGSSTDVRIEGNFLGTDPSGETDLGNGFSGVSFSGGSNTVGGPSPGARNLSLTSTPGTTFTVQFFSNPADAEGRRFVGQKSVTAGADGRVTFAFSPANAVPVGQRITATATGLEGTSEFSAPREVVAG